MVVLGVGGGALAVLGWVGTLHGRTHVSLTDDSVLLGDVQDSVLL